MCDKRKRCMTLLYKKPYTIGELCKKLHIYKDSSDDVAVNYRSILFDHDLINYIDIEPKDVSGSDMDVCILTEMGRKKVEEDKMECKKMIGWIIGIVIAIAGVAVTIISICLNNGNSVK